MKLSKKQAKLLAIMKLVRKEAEATEAEANARALGGLSDVEKLERQSVLCCSYASVRHEGVWLMQSRLQARTFHALVRAGVAEHVGRGFYRAI